jgi:hypothetical protein
VARVSIWEELIRVRMAPDQEVTSQSVKVEEAAIVFLRNSIAK